jgi:exonuclease V gamma subunit
VHFTISGEILLAQANTHLLVFRTGKVEKASHWIGPWIHALFAAATEHPEKPLIFLSESDPQPNSANTKAPIPPEEAKKQIEALLRGYALGQTQPLPYAPNTTHVIAKHLDKMDPQQALAKARAEVWESGFNRQNSEGEKPAAKIAWRDRDPFEDAEGWLDWADAIARPLKQWGNLK